MTAAGDGSATLPAVGEPQRDPEVAHRRAAARPTGRIRSRHGHEAYVWSRFAAVGPTLRAVFAGDYLETKLRLIETLGVALYLQNVTEHPRRRNATPASQADDLPATLAAKVPLVVEQHGTPDRSAYPI